MNPCEELDRLLRDSGLKVRFGLEAQGHIPTIEFLLKVGASWATIGRKIGWHGPTAERFYLRYLARLGKDGE